MPEPIKDSPLEEATSELFVRRCHLLPIGKIIYKGTEQDITVDRINNLISNFDKMQSQGKKIPVLIAVHAQDPVEKTMNTVGYVQCLSLNEGSVEPKRDGLYADISILNPDVQQKVANREIQDVSIGTKHEPIEMIDGTVIDTEHLDNIVLTTSPIFTWQTPISLALAEDIAKSIANIFHNTKPVFEVVENNGQIDINLAEQENITIQKDGEEMDLKLAEEKIQKLDLELAAKDKVIADKDKIIAEKDLELAKGAASIGEMRKQIEEQQKALEAELQTKITTFVDDLISNGIITPEQKDNTISGLMELISVKVEAPTDETQATAQQGQLAQSGLSMAYGTAAASQIILLNSLKGKVKTDLDLALGNGRTVVKTAEDAQNRAVNEAVENYKKRIGARTAQKEEAK